MYTVHIIMSTVAGVHALYSRASVNTIMWVKVQETTVNIYYCQQRLFFLCTAKHRSLSNCNDIPRFDTPNCVLKQPTSRKQSLLLTQIWQSQPINHNQDSFAIIINSVHVPVYQYQHYQTHIYLEGMEKDIINQVWKDRE